MCGIAGIAEKNHIAAEYWMPVIHTMLEIMRHRGPDDRGSIDLGSVLLGHLRLSILDLSDKGHQPMLIDDGNYVITFNGEVYNYVELRRELENMGARFNSGTDTEVILQAYKYWGTDCFARFNGMWALAIWDKKEQQLVLSRDRVGIKPLYYCCDGNRFAFASELKSLLSYRKKSGLPINLNVNSVQIYINTGVVDGLDETFFSNIYRFKSGQFMIVKNGEITRQQVYWNLPQIALTMREQNHNNTQEQQAEQLLALFGDAIQKHLRSDVPVGVCLSGGLDSSLVAGLCSRDIDNLKTFTSWFSEGDEWNEIDYAEKINTAFNLNSFKIKIDRDRVIDKIQTMLWYLDEPTMAMGIIPQWHVMEGAAQEVKVVLDGQGGDELFAGYDFYASHILYSCMLFNKMSAYKNIINGYYTNYGLEKVFQLGNEVKQLYTFNARQNVPALFPGHLDNFLFKELLSSRLPALLRYEDRLSMAFSIESRVPLLDHRIIEFAFSAPEELKSGPGWSKYIMRQAVQNYLPAEITWRKDKKGFPTPFKVWADGCFKQQIRNLLLRSDGEVIKMTGAKQLQDFFQSWDAGQKNEWFLWRFLSLEIWLQTYLKTINAEIKQAEREITPVEQISTSGTEAPILYTQFTNGKPRICHIGGSHSIHVSSLVEELDRLGFSQSVFGYYPVEHSIIPKHVPVYSFPYRDYSTPEWRSQNLEQRLVEQLTAIIEKEKPDIVHGHSLMYSCIPVYMAKNLFNIPTIMQPWSIESITSPNHLVQAYTQRCINTLDYFLHGMPNIFKQFQNHFSNLPDEKYIVFRPLIDLSHYKFKRTVSAIPKILSSRAMGDAYRQDLLIKALPAIIKEFPQTRVTLIIGQSPLQGKDYFEKMITLAKELGVIGYCSFIPRSLTEAEFAELIQSHNIVYSIASHDAGFASTTVQAAYSGAITVVRDTANIDGILDHEINTLRTNINQQDITNTLLYAARNLTKLLKLFIKNNAKLINQDKRYMMNSLLDAYQNLYCKSSLNQKSAKQV